MPSSRLLFVVVAAVPLAACGSSSSGAEAPAPPAKTVTVTAQASTAAPAPARTSTSSRPKSRLRVPDVVGHNHQAAQNELQDAGFFHLHEKDATGEGRSLLWDRNWVVVRQSPRPGAVVPADTTITLYSKKKGE